MAVSSHLACFFLILRNCIHLGISFKGNLFDHAEEFGPVAVTETRSCSSESGWMSRSRSTRSEACGCPGWHEAFPRRHGWIGSHSAYCSRSVGYLIKLRFESNFHSIFGQHHGTQNELLRRCVEGLQLIRKQDDQNIHLDPLGTSCDIPAQQICSHRDARKKGALIEPCAFSNSAKFELKNSKKAWHPFHVIVKFHSWYVYNYISFRKVIHFLSFSHIFPGCVGLSGAGTLLGEHMFLGLRRVSQARWIH